MQTKIKKYLFGFFNKSDKKDQLDDKDKSLEENKGRVSDISGNPLGAVDRETNEDNLDDVKRKPMSKKTKKRIIIWTIVIVIFLMALGGILYAVLRPTEILLTSPIQTIQVSDDKKTAKIQLTAGNWYTIDITNPSGTTVYYIGNEKYDLYLDVIGNKLPLHVTLTTTKDTNGQLIPTYLNEFKIMSFDANSGWTPTLTTDPNAAFFITFLQSITAAWELEPAPFPWLSLISLLIPILFYAFLIFFILKAAKMQSGLGDMFGSSKGFGQLAKSDVKFSDVAGIKEEKEELSEIVDYLKNPAKYSNMGARTPRGVILYGPPGTGKTLLAKAVAGEANVPFMQTSGSQFEDMLVGVGAKRVRELFANARKSAPAIIFIDEIDSVANKRGSNNIAGAGGGVADQTINQLLAEMDGFNTSSGIVVIAATNRLDVLDEAILRPGRFDRHIQVNLPDIKEREEILKIHAKNKNISSKVDLYDIARRTPGFSGAQLENVLNEATLLAVRQNKTTVTEEDIDEGIDRVIGGPAKKSKTINQDERKLIAYHEAGHALVGLYSKGSDIVEKITIIPRGEAGGYTLQTPDDIERLIKTKRDLLNIIRATLGGRASEEVVYGPDMITTGASNDLYKVTNIVRSMVTQLGMTKVGRTQFIPSEGATNPYQEKLYSDAKALEIDNMIEQIIDEQYQQAKDIISKNRQELELIVETLLVLETIYRNQIEYIHKYKKLPSEVIEQKAKQKQQQNNSQSESEIKEITTNNIDDSNQSYDLAIVQDETNQVGEETKKPKFVRDDSLAVEIPLNTTKPKTKKSSTTQSKKTPSKKSTLTTKKTTPKKK